MIGNSPASDIRPAREVGHGRGVHPERLHLVAGARRDRPGTTAGSCTCSGFARAAGALLTPASIGQTDPMAAAEIDWAERAGIAEQAVLRRHLRRLGGVLPGTRIGRIRWPRRFPVGPYPWHYWWQAHLLDCLVDAQLRAPDPRRARHHRDAHPRHPAAQRRVLGEPLLRRHRLARARRAAGRPADPTVRAVGAGRDHDPAGRGLDRGRRRRHLVAAQRRLQERPGERPGGDPAGPRRSARVRRRPSRTGWPRRCSTRTPAWSATACGWPRTAPCARWWRLIYTYCQGVHLGTCVELAERDGHQRWIDRAVAIVDAITHRLARPGRRAPRQRWRRRRPVRRDHRPLPGRRRGAPPGARPRPRPGWCWPTRPPPGPGGPRSAAARCSPRTGPSRPPNRPRGVPEADLSVQLGAWMLLEAAARVQRSA